MSFNVIFFNKNYTIFDDLVEGDSVTCCTLCIPQMQKYLLYFLTNVLNKYKVIQLNNLKKIGFYNHCFIMVTFIFGVLC